MSKTKVTIQWAVKYTDGSIEKALDKEDAERTIGFTCDDGAIIVSREKTVTKTDWSESN